MVDFDDSEHLLLFIVVSSVIVFVGLFPPFIPCCTKDIQRRLVTLVWLFLGGVLALTLLAGYGVLPSDTFLRVLIVMTVVLAVGCLIGLVGSEAIGVATLPFLVIVIWLFKAYVNSFLTDALGLPAWPDYVYYMLIIVAFVLVAAMCTKIVHSDWITVSINVFAAWFLVIVSADILVIQFVSPGTTLMTCPSSNTGLQNTCMFTPDGLPYTLFIGAVAVGIVRWWIRSDYDKRQAEKQKNKFIKEHIDLRHSNNSARDELELTRTTKEDKRGDDDDDEQQSLLASIDEEDTDNVGGRLPSIHGSGMPILKRSSPAYEDLEKMA